jgi:hypothetical protein
MDSKLYKEGRLKSLLFDTDGVFMVGIQEYINKMQQGKPTPKDPYSHATYLISTEEEKIAEFHQLISKEVILASIHEDKLLKYYQRDIVILVNLFSMALRDPAMQEVFINLYYGWIGELAITRTKDGAERKLQGAVGQSAYAPKDPMLGFGMPSQPQQGGANIIQKFFPGQRQQQNNNQQQ